MLVSPSPLCGYSLSSCMGASRETTQDSAPGLGLQHWSPTSTASESSYTLHWGLSYLLPYLLRSTRAMCTASKSTQLMLVAKVTCITLAASVTYGIKWPPGAAVFPIHREGIRGPRRLIASHAGLKPNHPRLEECGRRRLSSEQRRALPSSGHRKGLSTERKRVHWPHGVALKSDLCVDNPVLLTTGAGAHTLWCRKQCCRHSHVAGSLRAHPSLRELSP